VPNHLARVIETIDGQRTIDFSARTLIVLFDFLQRKGSDSERKFRAQDVLERMNLEQERHGGYRHDKVRATKEFLSRLAQHSLFVETVTRHEYKLGQRLGDDAQQGHLFIPTKLLLEDETVCAIFLKLACAWKDNQNDRLKIHDLAKFLKRKIRIETLDAMQQCQLLGDYSDTSPWRFDPPAWLTMLRSMEAQAKLDEIQTIFKPEPFRGKEIKPLVDSLAEQNERVAAHAEIADPGNFSNILKGKRSIPKGKERGLKNAIGELWFVKEKRAEFNLEEHKALMHLMPIRGQETLGDEVLLWHPGEPPMEINIDLS